MTKPGAYLFGAAMLSATPDLGGALVVFRILLNILHGAIHTVLVSENANVPRHSLKIDATADDR
jgi:hypothetical protein